MENKKYKIIVWVLVVLLVIAILGAFYFFINKNNLNKEDYLEDFFLPEKNNLAEDEIEIKIDEEGNIIEEKRVEKEEEREKKEITQVSQSLVEKKDGILILKLDNGKNHIIPDVVGEDDEYPVPGVDSYNNSGLSRFYSYDKLHEDINYYGITVSYNVGNALGEYYLLVNKLNGNHVNLHSKNMVISPDKNRIVSYNQSISFDPNGFTILVKGKNGGFKTEAEVETNDWGPEGAKWISNKEIEFKKFDFVQDRVVGTINYVLEESPYGYNNWVEK